MRTGRVVRADVLRLIGAGLLLALGLAGVVGAAWLDPNTGDYPWIVAPVTMAVLVPAVVGILIVRRHRGHVVGWLLLAQSPLIAAAFALPPLRADHGIALALGQASMGAWVFIYLALVLVGYLFPDGRALSRRWRAWIWFCLAGYAVYLVGAAFDPAEFHAVYPGKEPPLAAPAAVMGAVQVAGLAVMAASLAGAVVCARQRFRQASGDQRLQLLWFAWGAVSIPLTFAFCWLVDSDLTLVVGIAVGGSVIPIVIGIAILRLRLFDIELVLSRTLTYSALTAGVIGTYAVVLWMAGTVADNRTVGGLLAVGVVAVAVQPAHAYLRRRVERLVYGDRADPRRALRHLSDRVEQTTDPTLVVQTVTDSVADAVKVDRVWVELLRDQTAPLPGNHVVRIPLAHRGERLGDLAVEVPPGRQLTTSDLALLGDLARHAAVVVNAVYLTLDLQRSRARLVTAREEERRRLRRDLHDGLGPSLAAIVLKLNAAQTRRDEHERNHLLAQTRDEARAAVAEVRRLVDDLRPPAIDEVGVIGAIRQRCATLSRDDLYIEVAGPAALPPLPAAVEVAAYRIATEAVTNVMRHANATRCVVHLAVNGAFELSISDNGRGAPPGTTPGVGWTSMTERAAELGGTCTISSRSEGGTLVRAVLPLPATSAHRTAA